MAAGAAVERVRVDIRALVVTAGVEDTAAGLTCAIDTDFARSARLRRPRLTGAGLAGVVYRAEVAVSAWRAITLGRVRADAGLRIADAAVVALIQRHADDGGAGLTDARLTGVADRAGVAIFAGGQVRRGRVGADAGLRIAGARHMALVERLADDVGAGHTDAGLAGIAEGTGVAITALRAIAFVRVRAEASLRIADAWHVALIERLAGDEREGALAGHAGVGRARIAVVADVQAAAAVVRVGLQIGQPAVRAGAHMRGGIADVRGAIAILKAGGAEAARRQAALPKSVGIRTADDAACAAAVAVVEAGRVRRLAAGLVSVTSQVRTADLVARCALDGVAGLPEPRAGDDDMRARRSVAAATEPRGDASQRHGQRALEQATARRSRFKASCQFIEALISQLCMPSRALSQCTHARVARVDSIGGGWSLVYQSCNARLRIWMAPSV